MEKQENKLPRKQKESIFKTIKTHTHTPSPSPSPHGHVYVMQNLK